MQQLVSVWEREMEREREQLILSLLVSHYEAVAGGLSLICGSALAGPYRALRDCCLGLVYLSLMSRWM